MYTILFSKFFIWPTNVEKLNKNLLDILSTSYIQVCMQFAFSYHFYMYSAVLAHTNVWKSSVSLCRDCLDIIRSSRKCQKKHFCYHVEEQNCDN